MTELYIFKTMQHYSDSLIALRHNHSVPDKPLKVQVNLIDLDFDYYRDYIKQVWHMIITPAECPFCFWNRISLAYMKPIYFKHPNPLELESLKSQNLVVENFIICPHKLYDLDFIDFNQKKYSNSTVQDIRDYFNSIVKDWNMWRLQLTKLAA